MTRRSGARGGAQIDLSIIIVSWNVRELLLNCLASIQANRGALTVEVIVIDNASRDGTVAAVEQHYPEVAVICQPINIGFAPASNLGIERSRGRNVLLLNPDTVVVVGALVELVRFADSHPEVGLVGPALVSPDGGIQYVGARRFPRLYDWFCDYVFLSRLFPGHRFFGGLLLSWWDHNDSREVECLCGACLLIPRRVVASIGLLDDHFPMYVEDIWYCMRSIQAGYRNFYLSEARVIHIGGASGNQDRPVIGVVQLQALLIHFVTHNGPGARVKFLALVLLGLAVRLPLSIVSWGTGKLSPGFAGVGWSSVKREWMSLRWLFTGASSEAVRLPS